MKIIAGNLNFRRPELYGAMRQRDKGPIQDLAKRCDEQGPDYLNLYLGPVGDAEDMRFVINAVQEISESGFILDSAHPGVVEAGIKECGRPPVINGVSAVPSARTPLLELVSGYDLEMIAYAVRNGTPRDAEDRITILQEIVEAANAAGISNDRIIVDPVILHITGNNAQHHAVAVQEVLKVLPEIFATPVRSTCWLSNISAGLPATIRPALNSVYLAMLAAEGLDMAILNVLDPEVMRTVRLIRALRDETIFTAAEAA
ncbi:MAG: dihydropteroate synthase [Candidatus Geothermincolia bacterium]